MLVVDDGTRLHYQAGGPPDGPALLFINSLGTDLGMWAPQAAALADHVRIVRYDTRGHGLSDAPPGPTPSSDWRWTPWPFWTTSASSGPACAACRWVG
jgi:pimeloyl-ACP methyl ester carboxylesterase